jgi:lipid-binding SYLF domain-containing protein
MKSIALPLVAVVSLAAAGCATPRGATIADKQAFVREMRDQALSDLYASRPDIQRYVEDAAGYAVFSNVNVHVLLLGGGQGYGVAVDNRTHDETFMQMGMFGLGPGLGMRDLRLVMVFTNDHAFRKFVTKGWEFSGNAEAAATSDDKGGAVGAQAVAASGGRTAGIARKTRSVDYATSSHGITVYQLTRAGLALQATVAGTKYWPDAGLN